VERYPWPTKVGIDEHLFKHDSRLNTRRFVTMIVDYKNKRLMEVVEGKENAVLKAELAHIPGRENVRWVALDLSDGYRNFAREFLPERAARRRQVSRAAADSASHLPLHQATGACARSVAAVQVAATKPPKAQRRNTMAGAHLAR
jgi:hypothetical protein